MFARNISHVLFDVLLEYYQAYPGNNKLIERSLNIIDYELGQFIGASNQDKTTIRNSIAYQITYIAHQLAKNNASYALTLLDRAINDDLFLPKGFRFQGQYSESLYELRCCKKEICSSCIMQENIEIPKRKIHL